MDREPLKAEIAGEHKLKKAETDDKSAPVIESANSYVLVVLTLLRCKGKRKWS